MEVGGAGLGEALLGVTSFMSSSHPAESCGMNGLPLTPNSISIMGASQLLKTARHQNLARYLDVCRGKHQRIIVVEEYWKQNLKNIPKSELTEEFLLSASRQILSALSYLNHMNIINLNLRPENVMVDENGSVKLFGFGLARMTNYGSWVAFPIGDPRLTAPEVFARGQSCSDAVTIDSDSPRNGNEDLSFTAILPEAQPPDTPSADVWSLGVLLASILLDIPLLWPSAKIGQIVRKILSLGDCDSGAAVLEKISREHSCVGRIVTLPQQLLDLIHQCLEPQAHRRPSPQDLLNSDIFLNVSSKDFTYRPPVFPSMEVRSEKIPWPNQKEKSEESSAINILTVQEIYYLWQLAGGDIIAELRKHGLMVTTPPLLSIPTVVSKEGQAFGQLKQRASLLDNTVILLPISQLESCLSDIPAEHMFPLIESFSEMSPPSDDQSGDQMAKLPLVIRERDVRYQTRRCILYRRLLQSYPFKRPCLWKEALMDTVPIYRSQIWASLLNIEFDVVRRYEAIDKESWSPVDRQIEVDIPRCHQYNELLASPEGHRKLKRVLKAWVVTNPELVYWQGLDSLAAPFLYLNFNDEALAWACLQSFIPKYLHSMFLKDNAAVIQEYLAKFSQLQAFHDPVLFNHLDVIGFIPDLYAIPWVLTMFSHVFPLHKIFHLWDRLLLGNSSFPLCVGLAVLRQLRTPLLEAQFNECILLFSDMPAVDIEQVVVQSMDIFCTTPASLTFRLHDSSGGRKSVLEESGVLDTAFYGSENLVMEPVSVQILRAEKVARLSGADLLHLTDIKKERFSTPKVLCIDIRAEEAYRIGSIPESINIPGPTAFDESGDLAPNSSLDSLILAKKKGKVICVAGSKNCNVVEFAESLVRLGYPRVCMLHNGVEIFRNSGILCVPNV